MSTVHPGWALAAFVAVVLATERLVTLARTTFPGWLEGERRNAAGEVSLVADRARRLRVQAVAFGAALAVAGSMAAPGAESPWRAEATRVIPLPLVALAASGAAAFWANCIRRVSAARALDVTRGAEETLRFRRLAESRGATPAGSGRAAHLIPRAADPRGRLLLQLYAHAPERLDAPTAVNPDCVWISRGGGPVSVRVRLRSPGAVVAVAWRFRRPAERDGAVGEIDRDVPELPLGLPGTVAGRGFLVDGYVVPPPSPSPTSYQVAVSVLQGGRMIHQAILADHGSGMLKGEEVRFRYAFRLRLPPPPLGEFASPRVERTGDGVGERELRRRAGNG